MNRSMGSVVVSAMTAALLAGAAMPADASTWRLDFDSIASATEDGYDHYHFNGKKQGFHGRIIDNEYSAANGGIPGIDLTDGVSPHPTVNLDYYDGAGNGSSKGLKFNNTDAHSFGVTISANNHNTTGNDHAVLFNTHLTGTRDRDMEDPFDAGPDNNPSKIHDDIKNITWHRPGHVLIIQESFVTDCSSGVRCRDGNGLGTADDEGDRPAGEIVFEFDELVNVHSLDFFDVELAESGPPPQIEGYRNGVLVGSVDVPETGGEIGCYPGAHTCQTHFNRVTFTFTDIDKLVVEMGGSGGIDNLYGSRGMMTQVPEPGPLAVFATGLLALTVMRRRLRAA